MMKSLNRFILCIALGALPALAGSPPGINNFDQVDGHVYRGAQPTAEGFHYLAGIGVMTVIDLREAGRRAQAEERIVKSSGMAYVNVPMTGLTPPTEAELLKILPVLENASGGSVFVHCRRGADRTGAVIAAYHIQHDHWDNSRALQDAKAHHMSIFQVPRQNFVEKFSGLKIEAKAATTANATAVAVVSSTPAAVLP